jgi:copper(I)-binding protein
VTSVTRRVQITCLAFGTVALLSAVGAAASTARGPGAIEVDRPWARSAQAGVSAGYLTLHNTGVRSDRLTGAASPWVEHIDLQTITTTGAVTRMRPLIGGLEIAPSGSLSLTPGGDHLMLLGLKRPLAPGDRLPVTLQFQRAGAVRVYLVVRAPIDRAP